MIPTLFLSDESKRKWLELHNAALPPVEFIAAMRLQILNESVHDMNEVDAGLIASIDAEGDVAYEITDLEKQYAYYKSTGFPAKYDKPELLAEHLAASALREKANRQAIREIAERFRRSLRTEHPRLAGVPLDIIPGSHVNAWAQPVPAGGDVVGLNSNFITRCWVWCDWFIWLMELPGSPLLVQLNMPEDQMPAWSETKAMLQTTIELAKAMMGTHGKRGQIIIEHFAQELERKGRNTRGDFYSKMMATIAILHEYGHIALGHTDWLRELVEDSVRGVPLRMSQHELRAQQRSNEYAADEFAAHALVTYGRESAPTKEGLEFKHHILGWSAQMLFSLFHFAQTLGMSDDDPDATHPVPKNRIAAFLARVGIDELGTYEIPG